MAHNKNIHLLEVRTRMQLLICWIIPGCFNRTDLMRRTFNFRGSCWSHEVASAPHFLLGMNEAGVWEVRRRIRSVSSMLLYKDRQCLKSFE